MRKLIPAFAIAAVLAAATTAAPADEITLKDGRVYRGKVVSESDDTVQFEVDKYGVKVQMPFKRAMIASIQKDAPDTPTPPAPPEPDEPATPEVDPEPQAVGPSAGLKIQDRGPNSAELFSIYAELRGREDVEVARKPLDEHSPTVGPEAEILFTKLYGPRIEVVNKSGNAAAQFALSRELLDGALLTKDDRPGLGRKMVLESLQLLAASGKESREWLGRMREILVELSEQNNPRHMNSIVEFDLLAMRTVWDEKPAEAQRYYALAVAGVVQTTSAYLKNDYRVKGGPPSLTKMQSAVRNLTARPVKRAGLALEGQQKILEVTEQLNKSLAEDPADQVANKEMALIRLVYMEDPAAARDHLARVTDDNWAPLREAAAEKDGPRGVFLLGDGLHQLARKGEAAIASQAVTVQQVQVKARELLQQFVDMDGGDRDDKLIARLRLNELAGLIRQGSGEVTFFGATVKDADQALFVIDQSGYTGTELNYIQAEVIRSINQLRPTQRFQVVMFGQGSRANEMMLGKVVGAVPATGANKIKVEQWINSQVPGIYNPSSAQLTDAINKILPATRKSRSGVFIVCGTPLSDAERFTRQQNQASEMVVNIFTLGRAPQAELKIFASNHKGVCRRLGDSDFAEHY